MVNIAVGVLATSISVVTLLLTTVFHKLCENIAAQCVRTRLHSHTYAPFVTANDLWLPNAPSSLFKFRRHPGVFLTVCLATLLILAELILELGVEVTSNCTPVIRHGPLIGDTIQLSTRLPWHVPDIELSAIAFMLQLVSFRDGDFTHISHGFPRRITNDLCVKCLPKATPSNTIASGCTVGPARPVHGVSIGVKMTDGAFLAFVTGMNVTSFGSDGSNGGKKNQRVVREFHGMGDVTRTVHTQYVVTFVSKDDRVEDKEQSSGHTVQYWEYSNQDHISKLCNAAIEKQDTDTPIVTEVTKGPVYRRSITCDTNTVHMAQFVRALLVYRTVHMENIQRPAEFIPVRTTTAEGNSDNKNGKGSGSFDPLTVSDVYRAILAVKVAEELPAESDVENGSFFEYPQCATYNWRFAIPTAVALLSIALLGMSVLCMRLKPVTGHGAVGCSDNGTEGEKIGAALKMLQDSDLFIVDASNTAVPSGTCGNAVSAVGSHDTCDDSMHRKRISTDASSIGACGDFDAHSATSSSFATSSDSDSVHTQCNSSNTINMDELTAHASTPDVPPSQHGGGLITYNSIVLRDSGSMHGGDRMPVRHGSARGSHVVSANAGERTNGRRLWSAPWLAEANQIVVVRDERNEVSGIQVIPFEESPAGLERRASNIS